MSKIRARGARYAAITIALSLFIFANNAFGQKAKTTVKDTKPAKDISAKSVKKDLQPQPMSGDNIPPKKDTEKSSKPSLPDKLISDNGFGAAMWGDSYQAVKSKVVGEVKEKNDGDFIISQVGELTMKYGFFRNPLELKKDTPAKEIKTMEGAETGKETEKDKVNGKKDLQISLMTEKEKKVKEINDRAKLFYVTIRLPYILSDRIEEKLNQRLGKAQGKNVKANQGVIWWETSENLVLLWVDDVSGAPYSRKIDIIGRKIREEIKVQQREMAKMRENKILSDLNF